MKRSLLTLGALVALSLGAAIHAADWQFSVPLDDKGKSRAFLWIPPGCQYVRGVILSGQVILEKCVVEDPRIRAAATKEGLAIILDMKSTIGYDLTGDGKGRAQVQTILDQLAQVSGYSEIAQAPLLGIGHSGGAIFAWNLAYGFPDRCFGVVGVKAAPIGAPAGVKPTGGDGGAILNNIPVLCITGQYEAWGNPLRTPEYHWRWVRGTLLDFRARGHNPLMCELVEPGTTHFSWYDELAEYVAMFIQKAAHKRIPAEGPPAGEKPKLIDIPQEEGWLTDVNFFGKPRHATAAFKDYEGDPSMAFWHLDEEMARANDNYGAKQKGKKFQQIAFFDEGKPVPPGWMIEVPFHPIGDGMTFKVTAGFLDETSPDFSKPEPRKLGHGTGPINYRLIGGWCGGGKQVGPDTFRFAMDRFSWVRPSGSIMFIASHPGDAEYALYEQPGSVKYPDKLKEGTPQKINFALIPDQKEGAGPVTLSASCDSGLPIDFFVIEGPAEVEGNKLTFTPIPARAKRPVKVTVGAWQWGRTSEPKVQTAEPVTQTFNLN